LLVDDSELKRKGAESGHGGGDDFYGGRMGRLLLGADELERRLTGGEAALLDFIDRAQMAPEEAIVQLAQRMAISELSPTTNR
jgi:hypothetical protein